MQIIILEKAEKRLHDTARYIRDEFGKKSEQKFKKEFRKTIGLLKDNPYLGPVEPLLLERIFIYRSIVVARLNKIIYRIDEDRNRIEIADLWDCRREPTAMTRQVR